MFGLVCLFLNHHSYFILFLVLNFLKGLKFFNRNVAKGRFDGLNVDITRGHVSIKKTMQVTACGTILKRYVGFKQTPL